MAQQVTHKQLMEFMESAEGTRQDAEDKRNGEIAALRKEVGDALRALPCAEHGKTLARIEGAQGVRDVRDTEERADRRWEDRSLKQRMGVIAEVVWKGVISLAVVQEAVQGIIEKGAGTP